MANISLILTFYNEAKILEQSVNKIVDFFNLTKLDCELIFIDDNSNDTSKEILEKLKKTILKDFNTTFIYNEKQMGRGACVDIGFIKAKSDIVGFIDTDLDIPIYYILPAYQEMKNNNWDALIGRRSFLYFFEKFLRILMTQTYSLIVRKYLDFPYQQTEAGFKFFKKEKYMQIRHNIEEKHWFWDTEVMFFCNAYKFNVCEMPITVIQQNLRPTNVKFVKDTIDSMTKQYKLKNRMKKLKKNDSRN